MPFGKYEGKTLPEIILIDLDWFYWALPKLYGKIAEEAQDLARKVRAIKIPKPNRKKLEVEYRYERGDRFRGFAFVKASSAQYSRWSTRLPHLDLSRCLRRRYTPHVWTAPSWQEESSRMQPWSVRPCVRPFDAAHMTAGHNALRGSGPDH